MRVAIIDDHPIYREGVAHVLAAEPDVTIVGTGESAGDAARLLELGPLDILLLDLDIPGTWREALGYIGEHAPTTRVVILTASESETSVLAAIRLGALGYVLKGVSARDLMKIIRDVYGGQRYVSPTLAAVVLNSALSTPLPVRSVNHLENLSERDQQILNLLATGSSNQQIASTLHLAEPSIRNRMTVIMKKLQVRNRVEAALLAREIRSGTS